MGMGAYNHRVWINLFLLLVSRYTPRHELSNLRGDFPIIAIIMLMNRYFMRSIVSLID